MYVPSGLSGLVSKMLKAVSSPVSLIGITNADQSCRSCVGWQKIYMIELRSKQIAKNRFFIKKDLLVSKNKKIIIQ